VSFAPFVTPAWAYLQFKDFFGRHGVVNLSPLASSCDESEDLETVLTKDVKCELVARMHIIFLTVERHYVHEFPYRTAVFMLTCTGHICSSSLIGLVFFY